MSPLHRRGLFRLVISVLAGGATSAVLFAVMLVQVAAITGWIVTAVLFCGWTWAIIGRFDAAQTRDHATEEDPGRRTTGAIMILASLASLAGVGVMLSASAREDAATLTETGLGVLGVAASWVLINMVFLVRYAELYYESGGGVDFNQDHDPDYRDFAYLSFTVGMSYSVGDTSITGRTLRRSVLRHMFLSYLLGVVVVASTVNLVIEVASGLAG